MSPKDHVVSSVRVIVYCIIYHICNRIADQVISQVGPVVSRLTDFDSSDDYRSEGATVSSHYCLSLSFVTIVFQFLISILTVSYPPNHVWINEDILYLWCYIYIYIYLWCYINVQIHTSPDLTLPHINFHYASITYLTLPYFNGWG